MNAELDKRITFAAERIGYPKDALLFVLGGLHEFQTVSRMRFDSATLCWKLHDRALRLFGSDARKQLDDWGITTTLDFGNIVFGLSVQGVVRTIDNQEIEDFDDVFRFPSQFLRPKYGFFNSVRRFFNSVRQWDLSMLFLVTTIAAMSISGFTRNGLRGGHTAFLSSGFGIVGLACIYHAITSRENRSDLIFLVAVGIFTLSASIYSFVTLSFW